MPPVGRRAEDALPPSPPAPPTPIGRSCRRRYHHCPQPQQPKKLLSDLRDTTGSTLPTGGAVPAIATIAAGGGRRENCPG